MHSYQDNGYDIFDKGHVFIQDIGCAILSKDLLGFHHMQSRYDQSGL